MTDTPASDCMLIARPHPLHGEPVYCQVRAGQTIARMLGEVSDHAIVSIGGHDVPRKLWAHVKPKAGQHIHITIAPQGGKAGKWVRIVALVALTFFTAGIASGAYLAGTATALGVSGATLAAVVGLVGTMAINALLPPPGFGAGGQGGQDPYNQLQAITGTQNQATPYGPIACVVGQAKLFPQHAALPYTEISGDDQYLRMLLDLGHGDLDISDIKIGETAIGDYDDVEWEIGTAPALFTQDIFELTVGTVLASSGDSDTRTTQNPTDEISVDLAFPQGLFGVDNKGNTIAGTVQVTVEYRLVGGSTWSNAAAGPGLSLSTAAIVGNGSSFTIKSGARKLLRCGIRWTVPTGQYEVRVTRGTFGWLGSMAQGFNTMAWGLLRSISHQLPSTTGTTKLAVRIKATDQLNGVVSTLNCVIAQRVRRWDGLNGVWLAPVATQNPAWVSLWLMTQCPAVIRRLGDERVDINAIAQWAAECEAKGLAVGMVLDSQRAFGDLLRDVFATGRATMGLRNGLYSPVRDIAQTVPVQMFTPANSSGFSYSRSFLPPPHALRVKFRNPAENQEDTRTVYWDGYSAANATRFEELDLRMVDSPDAVWRLARYYLAVMWLRPTQYSYTADIEHLVVERGDLVHVAHDITGWGVGWGRVRAIAGSTVTLDQPVTLEAGKTYVLRIRTDGNEQHEETITSPAGETASLTLAAPLTGAPGDLWVVGEVASAVAALIVRKIETQGELAARLTCVDASPAVWDADAGTPPAFVSEITGQPWCAPPPPPTVNIRAGNTAPDDSGVIKVQPGVSGQPPPGIHRIPIMVPGCVVVTALLPDGRTAGDVRIGDTLALADAATLEPATGEVSYSEAMLQPCVEIITESGVTLQCSSTAPIPTPEGLRLAPDLAGRQVAVLVDGIARWERVKRLRGIGKHLVQHITCGNACFWAGSARGFILHHNLKALKPNRGLY